MELLPDSYRWSDGAEASYLYLRYGCVATVRDRTVRINHRGRVIEAPCTSRSKGKEDVEIWLAFTDSAYARERRWRTHCRESKTPSKR